MRGFMHSRAGGVAIGTGVVLMVAVASYAVFVSDPWAERGDQLPSSFQLNLDKHVTVDPALIGFWQQTQITLPLERASALATGPEGRIYVGGDGIVLVLNSNGATHASIKLEGTPTCLAVGGDDHVEPGRIYAGMGEHIEIFDADGESVGNWPVPQQGAVLTSIAVTDADVFVADAGNRCVYRYDIEGQVLGQIGHSDANPQSPQFVVPSPYFDVAAGTSGLVHIVNPGKLQVTTCTYEGDFGKSWGTASSDIRGFFGCCNPSHLAVLPDGRFVTSEKGIPRVKVYGADGTFESVVAGPEQLSVNPSAVGDPRCTSDEFVFEVATDIEGRVLVLDAITKSVRIFEATSKETGDAG